MNIGIICYPTFGGSGVVATELGIALAQRGHNIHFITYRRPARLSHFQQNTYFHEVNTPEYPLFQYRPYDTVLASKIVDIAIKHKLDLLHVHYAIPHATIAWLAKQILKEKNIHLPIITTLHGTDITLVGNDPSFFPVVEFSINQSDGVTAVSEYLKNQTYKTFHIQKDIKVIYNGVDFSRFVKRDSTVCRDQFVSPAEKIIMHVSNFRKVKRIEDILRAFKIINTSIPSKLLLIGDGPERVQLENLSQELGISSQTLFLGNQDAVEELLAIADLFFLPSEHESFGLAALEAMACEVPIISSDVGGLTEVNIDGVTGYICPVGDYKMMAERSISLLSNDTLLKTFRAQALQRAKEFELDNIVSEYENYYNQIVKLKNGMNAM